MTFKKYGIGLAVAAALGVAGSAQGAIMIDDMAYTGSSVVTDTTPGGGGVSSNVRGTGSAGAWTPAVGSIYVNLIAGDLAQTADCSNCEVGHTVNNPSSVSHSYAIWNSPNASLDLNFAASDSVAIDYETDVMGGDIGITLFNNGTQLAQMVWWDLGATGLTAAPGAGQPLPRPLQFAQTLSFMPGAIGVVDEIRVDVFSDDNLTPYTDGTGVLNVADVNNQMTAVGLDTNLANLRKTNVPEPTTLAMLGLGLAGLGWQRRRKSA